MGIKLLTLEGSVLVSPAQLRAVDQRAPWVVPTPSVATDRPPIPDGSRPGPHPTAIGSRLDDAAVILQESDVELRAL
jgi:hypothetical protein